MGSLEREHIQSAAQRKVRLHLVFHDERGALEYDFVVAPGADPARIRFAVEGARDVHVDEHGDLRLGGDLVHRAPVVYQEMPSGRRPVAGRYVVTRRPDAPTEIAFAVDAYDGSQALVIDPA